MAKVAETLRDLGCYEISLGDIIGVGTPEAAKRHCAIWISAALGRPPASKVARARAR